MHLSSHNTEQQLRALVFNLVHQRNCLFQTLCAVVLKIHRLKSGLQASSLSSPLKIGQSQPGI